MRDDLNKLLCERERRGSRMSYKQARRSKKFRHNDPDGEDALTSEAITFRHSRMGTSKEFNENLNPLLGQVRKAIGKPWNRFYSDLCKTFDKRSVINQHILQHLYDYVSRDTYVSADGVLMLRGKYGSLDRPLSESSSEFYVDSRDGIIKYNKHYRRYKQRQRERDAQSKRELDAKYRELDDGSVLHLIDGTWFHYTLQDAPKGHYVYDKPADKFVFTSSWSSRAKSWEQLSEYERRSFGVKRFVGETAVDLLTGDRVFQEAGKPAKKCHTTKRTASHKFLKSVGLVG